MNIFEAIMDFMLAVSISFVMAFIPAVIAGLYIPIEMLKMTGIFFPISYIAITTAGIDYENMLLRLFRIFN